MPKEIIEVNFRVAVKAFIVHNDKLLLLKRASDDIQKPNIWEIPGGRLNLGEDPILGIMREIKEETGLYITPKVPLSVRHFVRVDEQVITMLVFFCKPTGGDLKISEEHSDIQWIPIENVKNCLNEFFHKEVDIYNKLNLHNLTDF